MAKLPPLVGRDPALDSPILKLRERWAFPGVSLAISKSGKGFKLTWHWLDPDTRKRHDAHGVKAGCGTATRPTWDECTEIAEAVINAGFLESNYATPRVCVIPGLEDVSRKWLEHRLTHAKKATSTVKQNARAVGLLIDCVERRIQRTPRITDLELCDFAQVGIWGAAHGGRKGNGMDNSTIRNYEAAIRVFWEWLGETYYADHRICPKPSRDRGTAVELSEKPDAPILTLGQVDLALPWFEARRESLYPHLALQAFMLLRGTGLRIKQVCLLQWVNVDLDEQRIRIVHGCKTKAEAKLKRWIAIPPWLVSWLKEQPKLCPYVIASTQPGARKNSGGGGRGKWPAGSHLDGVHWLGCNSRQGNVAALFSEAWADVGVPSPYWQGHLTRCIRKAFRTDAGKLANYTSDKETLTGILEYHIGHQQGLRGVYSNIWRELNYELRSVVRDLPAPGEAQGEPFDVLSLSDRRSA
jgi:integrase